MTMLLSLLSRLLRRGNALTNRFSILPSVYGRFLIGKEIPYSKLNAMGGDVPSRFLQQQLPFCGNK